MVRLRHTLLSGFPRMCLTSRMPCTSSASSLVKPDVRVSRIRLSPSLSPWAWQAVAPPWLAGGSPAQLLIVLVRTDSLGNPIRSLAAFLFRCCQRRTCT